jgi:cell division initiation protein
MSITPVDLRNQRFQKKFRGYDPFYVDTIISEAATEMEKLIDTNTELRRQINNLEEKLKSYQNIEASLKQTLLTAEQTAEEKRRVSERQSETMLKETEVVCAELKAEQMKEVEKIKLEIAQLRMQKVRFFAELKSVIDTHTRILEDRKQIDEAPVIDLETVHTDIHLP